MNHNQKKTLCFVGTALVIGMIAFFTRPASPGVDPDKELGTKLFAEFDDPLTVTSLEIVKYDEDSFAISDFTLTQVVGVWSITSHENYPADAKDQVSDAASSVMDLTILGIATDKASEHELFGVVEPDKEKINVGATGVGTLVTMKDVEGNLLARMIIGKKVFGKDELRYVRKANQDRVYTVKVDTDKLSTKFEDWIEKDLLKLDAFQLKRVTLNDYAIVNVRDSFGRLVPAIQERSAMTFAYEDFKWKLKDLKQPNAEKQLVTVQPAEDEEPNTTTLNDLKNALDDLKIVNVERKPEQLAANFKSGKPLQLPDQDGRNSLRDRGFIAQVEDGKLHIYSDSGEVFAGMNDGVEYVLYFGRIAGGGVSGSQDDDEKDDAEKDDDDEKDEQKKETESKDESDDESDDEKKDDSDDEKKEESDDEKKEEFGLNRFILVSVRFNADLVPKPEFKPLPPVEAPKPAEQKSEPSTDTEKSTDQAKDSSEDNEDKADSKNSKEDETSQNGDSDESADEKKTSSEDEAKKKADEEKAKQEAERKKIEEENKKAQEDYEKKLKDGQESVRKLNFRFADWYFVISEDVYKKIHLGKEDVLKKKEEKEEDSGNGNLPSSLDNIPSNFNLPNLNSPPN